MVKAAGVRCCMPARHPQYSWRSVLLLARAPHHRYRQMPHFGSGLEGALGAAWAIAEALKPAGKPLDIRATATDSDSISTCAVRARSMPNAWAHSRVWTAHKLARLTRHGELVAQHAQPYCASDADVPLPPAAFLQATAEGEATLARLVLEQLGKASTLPTCSPASEPLRCGSPSKRASAPPTRIQRPSRLWNARPLPPPASNRLMLGRAIFPAPIHGV